LDTNIKIILDLSIGDGSLQNYNRTDAIFTVKHGIRQLDYAKHKLELLNKLGYTASIAAYTDKSGQFAGRQYVVVRTSQHPDFTEAYGLLYENNHKILSDIYLHNADGASLAYLFMDDGSAHTRNKANGKFYIKRVTRDYIISTQSFSVADNEKLRMWLMEKFSIESKILYTKDQPRIHISRLHSRDIFRDVVSQYILPSLRYKISFPHSFSGIDFL
jgi:hypothetical protein